MDVEKLLGYFGHSVNDDKLSRVLLEYNIDLIDEFKSATETGRAYLSRQQTGFSLVFTDEALFLNKGEQPFGKGTCYFTGIFLYSEGKDGFSQYCGELPNKLKFSDTRDTFLEKLGSPSWQRKSPKDNTRIVADRWDLPEYRVYVTYYKENNLPQIISFGIPDKE